MLFRTKNTMVSEADALPGRTDQTMPIPAAHHVNGRPLVGPWPDGFQTVIFGLGCFWGAEEAFWQLPGVYSTAVGYAGGFSPNPTYEEVCSGRTGHTEAVLVVYDPAVVSLDELLKVFWEVHDPTQGMRQGNDVGSQYRSAVYLTDESQRDRGRADPGSLRRGAARRRPGRDHDRDRAARALLLRRAVSPAVPRQEPARLPLSRRHRRPLPRLSARRTLGRGR